MNLNICTFSFSIINVSRIESISLSLYHKIYLYLCNKYSHLSILYYNLLIIDIIIISTIYLNSIPEDKITICLFSFYLCY